MKTALPHKSFSGILALALLAGCSLRDPKQAFQINVQMPKNASAASVVSKAQATTATGATGTPATDPASVAAALGYSCFALNIVGAGIAADSRFGCSDPTMGQMVGMVGLSGGTLSADVLAGPARKIQLIGIKFEPGSAIQNCATFESLLSSKASFDGVDPYNLGEITSDIFSDVSVSITASFTSPPKMFDQCDDNGKGGGDGRVLGIGFNSNSPMTALGQTLASGTTSPGTFQAYGGTAPYTYSFTLVNAPEGTNIGSVSVSADTKSAVYSIMPTTSSWSSLVQVIMKVTDATGATATNMVPVGGPAASAGLIAPTSVPLGSCVPVQVMAVDGFGVPALAASTMGNMNPSSWNSSPVSGYYYSDPACGSGSMIGLSPGTAAFTTGKILAAIGTGAYGTVYFQTPASGTSITLTLNGTHPATATVTLTQPVSVLAIQNFNSPLHLPTAIARGVCLSAPIQAMLEDSTGNITADATARTLQLSGDDPNTTQFYSDANCSNPQTTFALTPYQVSTGQLYLKTTSKSATATWTIAGTGLPSKSLPLTVYDPSLPMAPDDVRLNNQADDSLQVHGTFLATDSIRMFLDVACTGTPIDTQLVGASGFNAGYFKFTLPTEYTGPHNYYVQDVNAVATTSVCSGPFSINAW